MKLVKFYLLVGAIIFLLSPKSFAGTPTIGFDLPNVNFINIVNQASLGLGGPCSEGGQQITIEISGQNSLSAVCSSTNSRWSVTNVSASQWPNGSVTFNAKYKSNPSVSAIKTMTKDTQIPYLTIIDPFNGYKITSVNQNALVVHGTCIPLPGVAISSIKVSLSDVAQSIIISVNCDPMTSDYSVTLNPSTLIDEDLHLEVTAFTTAGNFASSSSSYVKDTLPVTVTIASAPGKINSASVATHTASGSCSSIGSPVFLDLIKDDDKILQSFTETCSSNKTWKITNISMSAMDDGDYQFRARHFKPMTQVWATPVTKTMSKDTVAPNVTFAAPTTGYKMNLVTGTELSLIVPLSSEMGLPRRDHFREDPRLMGLEVARLLGIN